MHSSTTECALAAFGRVLVTVKLDESGGTRSTRRHRLARSRAHGEVKLCESSSHLERPEHVHAVR